MLVGSEFGRTPVVNSAVPLRAQRPRPQLHGFTVLLAGGGVKPGLIYGTTDDFGFKVVENRSTCTICTRPFCTCSASITSG